MNTYSKKRIIISIDWQYIMFLFFEFDIILGEKKTKKKNQKKI